MPFTLIGRSWLQCGQGICGLLVAVNEKMLRRCGGFGNFFFGAALAFFAEGVGVGSSVCFGRLSNDPRRRDRGGVFLPAVPPDRPRMLPI